LSLYANRRRWAALPMGELHSPETCAYCGYRGRLDIDMRRTVIVSTHAVGYRCEDVVACARRRKARLD
jgi:hypothetical protein